MTFEVGYGNLQNMLERLKPTCYWKKLIELKKTYFENHSTRWQKESRNHCREEGGGYCDVDFFDKSQHILHKMF